MPRPAFSGEKRSRPFDEAVPQDILHFRRKLRDVHVDAVEMLAMRRSSAILQGCLEKTPPRR